MNDPLFNTRNLNLHPAALAPDYLSSRLRSPNQTLVHYDPTQTEMTGPVFGHNILGKYDNDLTINHTNCPASSAIGPRIIVHGKLLDENAKPVPGKMIEVWQANAGGRYRHRNDTYLAPLDPNFGGSGRFITADDGSYSFRTVQPGPYPWPNGGNDWRPAHIHFSIFGEGFAQRLITQMYFEGDPHIALCPIAQAIPCADALQRLIARLDMNNTIAMDIRAYRFDIVLRGRRASYFENKPEGI